MVVDRSLEDIFVEQGVVSKERLQELLASRPDASESVGDLLLRHGVIDDKTRLKALALSTSIPFCDLSELDFDPETARRLPHSLAVRHRALLIDASSAAASIAMANPLDLAAQDDISRELKLEVDPMWASFTELADRIVEIYGSYTDLDEIVSLVSQGLDFDDVEIKEQDQETEAESSLLEDAAGGGGPIIQLVNALFSRAVKTRASDIHIEPRAERVKVRFRVDGILRDIMEFPKEAHRAVVSRIKVVSGLDIAERRLPQDGRCTLQTSEGKLDFRVATYPTVNGEKITVRVLDKRGGPVDIDALALDEGPKEKLLRAVEASQGLVLVTGPTGSGKTTTLYALLHHANNGERQIITIEDPVEYQMDGIAQANVNNAAGVTFARGLRAMLRADPDVVLVGESRDHETAKTSIEAALTGHLVMTSLHANDSASAIVRLLEMGIEPFLVSAAVTCSVGQRLIRVNCPHCSEPYEPATHLVSRLGMSTGGEYLKGRGCDRCNGIGYRGRMAVYEILSVNSKIRQMILANEPSTAIRAAAQAGGMPTMLQDAINKVIQGRTTVEEVARVLVAED